MSEMQIQVDGAEAVVSDVAEVCALIQGPASLAAVGRGSRFIAAELSEAAPRGKTGNLAGSIGYEIVRGFESVEATIGARKPQGSHIHLVDKGTAERVRRDGRRTGRNKANPFVETTFESRRAAATDLIAAELVARVDGANLR